MFQIWGGAASAEWTRAADATVFSDMTLGSPASAFAPKLTKGHWEVISYEMTDGCTGNMIWASPYVAAPELKMRLPAKGWYAIFVGLFYAPGFPSTAWLKLDDDPAPLSCSSDHGPYYGCVEEVFFKVAKLSEESVLRLSHRFSRHASSCGISHIKLVPLTPEEIGRVRADRHRQETLRVAASIDGPSFSPTTREEVLTSVEIFRDTDFRTLILGAVYGDRVYYPSRSGYFPTSRDMFPFLREFDRDFYESNWALAEKGIHPVQTIIEGAHDIGMDVYVGMRPASWTSHYPYGGNPLRESPFYRQHPAWRCVDRDGTPVDRMSWAVPEVRHHVIEVLTEAVALGADGALIYFNRGVPVVLYESPVVERCRREYGVDPRTLNPSASPQLHEEVDARIVQVWSDLVAAFFRELRAALDREEQRRGDGKAIKIGAMVFGSEQSNLQYGIDVRRLISEGLLDEVFSYRYNIGSRDRALDLDYFREICAPRGIPFSPSKHQGFPPEDVIQDAVDAYAGGAAGVAVFNCHNRGDIYWWSSVFARLGRTEAMRFLRHNPPGEPPRTYCYFRRLGNQTRGRFGPWYGG